MNYRHVSHHYIPCHQWYSLFLSLYLYIYISIYECFYIHIYITIFIYLSLSIYLSLRMCIYLCIYIFYIFINISICICIYIYKYLQLNLYPLDMACDLCMILTLKIMTEMLYCQICCQFPTKHAVLHFLVPELLGRERKRALYVCLSIVQIMTSEAYTAMLNSAVGSGKQGTAAVARALGS